MPYADPEKQREAQNRSYRKRYGDAAFAAKEAARKAKWLQTPKGRASNRAASEAQRAEGIVSAKWLRVT